MPVFRRIIFYKVKQRRLLKERVRRRLSSAMHAFLMPLYFAFAFFLLPSALFSQDTIRYMSYNLLNYGVSGNFCTQINNNITLKDQYVKTIFNYVQPDLFAVCEMVPGDNNDQRLLDSAINPAGPRVFAKAAFTNFSNGDLVNMIYYDPEKFVLKSQDVVINSVRDINLYHFYLRTSDLATTHDTIFLTAIVAHLKAGNTSADELKRATMTLGLMNYLNAQNKQGNTLFSGDFNFYTSAEQGYQNLLMYSNASLRFFDPVNSPGYWSSNSTFSAIHTQSTHNTSNGCAASGGLDDRFDFILASGSIMDGTKGLSGMEDTYHALGQDGLHYNLSVNSPPANNSVPTAVLDALYGNSDHLPVLMDIRVAKTMSVNTLNQDPFQITIINPARGELQCRIARPPSVLYLEFIDIISRHLVSTVTLRQPGNTISLSLGQQPPGLYLLRFSDPSGRWVVKKVIVQ